MRIFIVLLKKELRELLTWQIIVPIVLIAALFFGLGDVLRSEQERSAKNQSVLLVLEDTSPAAQKITDVLKQASFTVTQKTIPPDQATVVAAARQESLNVALVVPKDFGTSIANGTSPTITSYTLLNDLSIIGNRNALVVQEALRALNTYFTAEIISTRTTLNTRTTLSPITTDSVVVVGDKSAKTDPAQLLSLLTQQNTLIPLILFLVITFATQMIATAIASEKESKTLESLLTMPVPRGAIVASKMIASGLIALGMSAVYLIGFQNYLRSVTEGITSNAAPNALKELGLVLQSTDYVIIGGMLFLSILTALALALILGTFAEDIKGVQGLLAPLMIMMMVPYLASLLIDLQSASPFIKIGINAIPFTHAFQVVPNVYLDRTDAIWGGAAYLVFLCFILTFIATKIFTTDRIITQRVSFGKK
jgi:ABC-2 type transport system permease protein